jgi:hypothetical protein
MAVRMARITVLAAAVAAALAGGLAAGGAKAAEYRLFPVTTVGPDGRTARALDVQAGNRVERFSAADGTIPAEAVGDPRRAFAWVRDHYGLDPARDRMLFCAGGIPLYTCVDHADRQHRLFPPPSWP